MSLVSEIDYGTPASRAAKAVTLTIDGNSVTVPEGTSIMRAAMEMGTKIPKLCATDMVDAFGSCRLCLVEIDGRAGTPASCTTPVAPGMIVRTQTDRLKRLRRGVMELYISDHPLDCLTCSANGDCELQDMAGAVGLRDVRYGYEGENHVFAKHDGAANPNFLPKDTSNPYFTYDPSKCIVCSRCVRACEETQGTFALTIAGRGFDSRVSPGMQESFLTSECVSCGACVQACPTATLNEKAMYDIGTPEHSVVTTCAYCGVGCAFKAEMRGDELVRMVPYKDGEANRGHSCVKGRFAWGYATHRERILKPMIRSKVTEPWREVGWDEAITYAASEFKRIQQQYGKNAVGGITSSRCTNEETFLVQKLIRAGFGNPIMHVDGFVRGKGKFIVTEYIATDEKTGPRFPLLLTTGRILSQYNVGAQTRRTENSIWHAEDVLEIHPHDAEQRGVRDGDWVRLASRAGETTLRAQITDRVAPGVVYTTFHHPDTQANVITTDYSDWATNCPEYKVTAVQVSPSNGPSGWQKDYEEFSRESRRIAPLEATE
jgi:predicted molibdopterin-dependent oxidoreductase YjgC